METAQCAVLFVEITDSVKISESLGDTVALALIKGLLARLEKIAAKFSGFIVTARGDCVVFEFLEADAALRAACEMQVSVNLLAQRAYGRLQIRAGFAYGPVTPSTGGKFGDTMSLCERLVMLARPSQILTSASTVEALSSALRASCRALPPAKIGVAAAGGAVSEVLWRYDPVVTQTDLTPVAHTAEPQMLLKLIYRANIFVVNRARPMLQMGRDDNNDVVIVSLFASRIHARVQARDGHFVLTDLSTNGTFVLTDEHSGAQSAELHLRRAEAMLVGRGWIGLGRNATTHGDHSVRFTLQPEGV